ncbi:MAG: DinB family protein [Gemmatimonadaceae bacterium]|jgi:hypothetical protein|nr:DinB family protein [Gemmatimonadaceae bacterium]
MAALPDLFDASEVARTIARLRTLDAARAPLWGRMTVAQMLAHCCVAYEMVYTTTHPRPNPLMRWVLRAFVKQGVVGPKPYPKSSPTAPAFRITDQREFEAERARLIAYVERVARDGRAAFEGRESLSFGPLTAAEWNTLFAKHLDHHLRQFGA